MKKIFLIPLIILLTSCSFFSPVKNNYDTYVLKLTPHCIASEREQPKKIIFVPPVQASPIYSTNLMAYTQCPYQLTYFGKNKWIASPPIMLHELIQQTLQNTGRFAVVTSSASLAKFQYVLSTKLIDFYQEFLCKCSFVHVKLRAQIVSANSGRIIATREFSAIIPSPYPTPYGGVIAANEATEIILRQLTLFCIQNT